ncbi:extracellular catalytic domain type 1 short-chain-length polyhydroxyalkanoate depolymerase [Paraburkholderia lycopersici]|uniref:Esterase, PHB depolymerase family n=1 Tax=Paraburkholderia lycopersici TaxID=416944 RepID=A0A1G6TN13_9BURK|nr:PHB depolymerase family esterase [Paraburkholderia lycopersici]SDD29876.1 esterase, PHB depolymerase family [Paraburkholderia lycopersici]
MPRKKTSVWFKGLELLERMGGARPKKKAGSRKAGPVNAASVTKPAKRAAVKTAGRAPPASTAGNWIRSYHSAPPVAGRLVNHLAYALYVPAGATSGTGMPLVVMLHGCKQTAESFAAGTRICRLADRSGFAVLLPEQAKTAHAQRCWHWHGDHAQSEAPAIVSLVDAIVRAHGFDSARVYLAGISAGAGLAAVLGMRYPWRFAALGLHSGPVFGAARSTMTAMNVMRHGSREDPVSLIETAVDVPAHPGMPTVIVQGEVDAVVAKRNALQLGVQFARVNRLLDAQGVLRVGEIRTYSRDAVAYTDYVKSGRLVVRLCLVRGLGHAWSGGDPREPFHSERGPDATAMMWQFFRRQRRSS